MEYHAASGSWHLARFIVKKRDKSGRVTNVLYVVRKIDKQKQQELEYREKLVAAAEEARRQGLGLNAGHDLSLENLRYFVGRIPGTDEVSIGHALICDALYYGLENTVQLYKRELK